MRYSFKRITVLAAFFITISAITDTWAGSKAEPLYHQKKVHVDEKQKNIYWPTDLPVWVRLAESPEQDAPSYLLQRTAENPAVPGFTDESGQGIQLSISGRQFIRVFNNVTQDTIQLKFFSDGDNPASQISFQNAPRYDHGGVVYFGNGLSCSISSQDPTSGVWKTFISVDGMKFEPYVRKLIFSRQKDYNLRYYAVDLVGNAAPPEETLFTVDLVSPVSSHEVINHNIGNILSPSASINVFSSDNLSGIREILYAIDDPAREVALPGQVVYVDMLSNGEHTLYYYAVDNVENRENHKKYAFYLDRIPPEPTSTVIGDQYHEGTLFVSAHSLISLSAEDNKIGVDRIEIALNSHKFKTYTDPFQAPLNAVDTSIAYRAVDMLGNTSDTEYLPLRVDVDPPVCQHSFSGPNYHQRGKTWISSNTRISLSARDEMSGVMGTWYKIGLDPRAEYTKSITIENEGQYDFTYTSFDRVNNRQSYSGYILVVDNTPPEIMVSFSISRIDYAKSKSGQTVEVFPRNTTVFIGATDASSSVERISYSLNGKKSQPWSAPIEFSQEGSQELTVTAVDRVGNRSVKTIGFIIKD